MLSLLLLSSLALASPPPCGGDTVTIHPTFLGTIEHPHIALTSIGVGQVCELYSPRPWLDAWLAVTPEDCDAGPSAALPLPAVTPVVICLETDAAIDPPGLWTAPVLLLLSPNVLAAVAVPRWP